MRSLSERKVALACLVAALPLAFLAIFSDARGWALIALVALGAIAAVSLGASDGRHPEPGDTERFLIGLLVKQGYSGAFRLNQVEHVISPGSRAGSVDLRFKASLALTEPLYQTTVPGSTLCGDYTPRRIAALGKIADQLTLDLEKVGMPRALRAPVDPFHRPYIAARSQQGWTLEVTGAARATQVTQGGWRYVLTSTPAAFGILAQTGRPRGAFFDAVVIDASDGAQWLHDTMQEWARFEEELTRLRATVEQQRDQRGHDALTAFFSRIRVGSSFQGTGETQTQKSSPLPFFLEITAIDIAARLLNFTLRRDRRSNCARHFSARVECELASGEIHLMAQTSAAEAVPHGGPLLNAIAAFAIAFRCSPDQPGALVGEGADFLMRLLETAEVDNVPVLAVPSAAALQRQREIWTAVAPGHRYVGSWPRGEGPVALTFLPGSDLGSIAAHIDIDDWTGTFRVGHPGAVDLAAGFDLLLEPTSVPVLAGTPGQADFEPCRRLLLRVAGSELTGESESDSGRVELCLRPVK